MKRSQHSQLWAILWSLGKRVLLRRVYTHVEVAVRTRPCKSVVQNVDAVCFEEVEVDARL